MKVDITDTRTLKIIMSLEDLEPCTTVGELKEKFHKKAPKYYPGRQSFKLEARGKSLKDEETLESLAIGDTVQLYFKDLGPQIAWKTVFMAEYAGPLVVYLLFYSRPAIIYGTGLASKPISKVVHIAAVCWSIHYGKRLLETLFIHRFSHATMPIFNLFKNCGYYWGFAAFIAYFINHPLYTIPYYGDRQVYAALAGFVMNELGNFSIHLALRNLRPEGTTKRQIPRPTSNPFTKLFDFVSCPNYTYEAGAWISFTVMSQTLPALFFTVAGFYQMSMWALGKHRNYRREFKDYPRSRKAIVPFLL